MAPVRLLVRSVFLVAALTGAPASAWARGDVEPPPLRTPDRAEEDEPLGMQDPAERVGGDALCLSWLAEHDVPFAGKPDLKEVRTAIEVRGPLGGVRLVPRAGRAPVMDCNLAQALVEAGPVFAELGIRSLAFSGAYDHRTRRSSSQLSEHAHGLAIDVHVLGTDAGPLDVARDFEAGVGIWRSITPQEGALEACIGTPATPRGRALRTLVCRLKLHSAFRVIVTPDDDSDHRDHVHLEAFPDTLARVRRIVGATPQRPRAPSRTTR